MMEIKTLSLVFHTQVYLIEYNQQLKDACIKSDKMTSTHKVIVIFEN